MWVSFVWRSARADRFFILSAFLDMRQSRDYEPVAVLLPFSTGERARFSWGIRDGCAIRQALFVAGKDEGTHAQR